MKLNTWKAPKSVLPSPSCLGEDDVGMLHLAVGRATSAWEHAESGMIKLFQLLCETRSYAACRAYGTIESVFGRHLALRYAAEEFFLNRDNLDLKSVLELIKAYNELSQYRNQIAHGMAVQPHAFGYFVCAPSYASRRRETPRPRERWGLKSDYFYRVQEIEQFVIRFRELLDSTMALTLYLNEKYQVLNEGDFHP